MLDTEIKVIIGKLLLLLLSVPGDYFVIVNFNEQVLVLCDIRNLFTKNNDVNPSLGPNEETKPGHTKPRPSLKQQYYQSNVMSLIFIVHILYCSKRGP